MTSYYYILWSRCIVALEANYKKKMMWYDCLTKQSGGEVVYLCTIFVWVSNMIILWYWWYRRYHDCYVLSTILLCLTAKSEVRYHCLSIQFRGELCLPTIWVLCVYLHKCGMVVSLIKSGGYLCITAIWRYCTVYYSTDGMYHDWHLKSCFLSASQGM